MQIELNKDEISMIYNSLIRRVSYYEDKIRNLSETIAKEKAGGMIFTEGTAEEYLVNADKELAKLQNFYSGYTNFASRIKPILTSMAEKRLTRKDMKNDGILFFDTETTGVFDRSLNPTKDWDKFPHIVQISWIINSTEHDYIILPDGWDIPDQAAQIHGITTARARTEGIPFVNAIYKFAESLSISNKIVAHNISFDIYMIVANVIRSLGERYFENIIKDKILKERQFDTMKATTDFCKIPSPYGGYKWPQLSELYKMLFNEEFPAYNSMEDVRAMVRCFYELCDRKIFKI